MAAFEYHRPRTLQDAWHLLEANAGAQFVAGGTDLLVRLRKGPGPTAPPALISLRGIEDLSGVELDGTNTRIGALTPIADLLRSQLLDQRFPLLREAAGRLGSPQIRNVATIGGNLCNASPCADTAPPLLVYDARVVLQSPRGVRELALEELFTGPGETALAPGEVLTRILLPTPAPNTRGRFVKKGRVRMDLAQVSVAVLLVLDDDRCVEARIAAGSVAPTPARLRPVERLFQDKVLSEELLAEAAQLAARSISPISDIRATADYRRQIVEVFVKRAVAQILQERS